MHDYYSRKNEQKTDKFSFIDVHKENYRMDLQGCLMTEAKNSRSLWIAFH